MRRLIALPIVLIPLSVLSFGLVFADKSPYDYDTNGNGVIDLGEAIDAVLDFFAGDLSLEHTKQVLTLYDSGQVAATPTPLPAPTPTPVPAPLPQRPSTPKITYTHINQDALQINWEYSEGGRHEVRYRRRGGSWSAVHQSSGSGVGFNQSFVVGAQYEVQVRAVNGSSVSPWARRTLVVPAPLPTLTPTPFVPTPVPTPFSNAYDLGCYGHSTDFPLDPPSDIKMVAWFANPGLVKPAPRNPWEPQEPPRVGDFSYGFKVRAIPTTQETAIMGLLMLVHHDGTWNLELRGRDFYKVPDYKVRVPWGGWVQQYRDSHGRDSLHLLSEGNLIDEGITFNTGARERNHLVFIAEGDTYQLFVNGEEVPLGITQSDIDAVREHVDSYYYHESGKWQGWAGFTGWVEQVSYADAYSIDHYNYWYPHYPHEGWRPLPKVKCVP